MVPNSSIVSYLPGQFVIMHDITLDETTNVAEHPEFFDRKKTIELSGSSTTGFFVADFTVEELKTLRLKQVNRGR